MLERTLAPLNRWALENVGREWIDYVVSNTMTVVNRRLNAFIWTYELKAQIIRVIDEAPGVKTFVLRPNQHWRGMKPGQFIELDLTIDGESHRRHYSPTLLRRGRIAITVKAVEGGKVSNWMHRHLRRGMSLNLGHPQGHFCHEGQRKMLFLCAGSGITPCRSIVDSLVALPQDQRPGIHFIAQFREAADVIFKTSLQRWAEAGVAVTTALSAQTAPAMAQQPVVPGQVQRSGRLDASALRTQCPDIKERDIYLCGPAGFMTQMFAELRELGVDMDRVHTERFVSAASMQTAEEGDFEVCGSEVFFQHLNTSITLTEQDQGKSLLDVARAHGVPVESGCCQGMCGSCRLTVREGHASGNVLGKVVYLCTAFPASQRIILDA